MNFTALTERLDKFVELGVPANDCIVYYKGEEVYRYQNGYLGKERYNIYSCSKPITCAAALQLYEKGMFKLEDKLSDYMPEFKNMTVKEEDGTIRPAKTEITIKDLFCMTAGFSYWLFTPYLELCRKETDGKCPTRLTMEYLAKEPLLFDPGERWEYSLCHDVLAALVEVLSGMPFEEYVKKNIFEPLNMNHSDFLPDYSTLANEITPLCKWNAEINGAEVLPSKVPAYRLGTEYASGGAGCVSTVEDYIKFTEAMRVGDVILKKETIDLMQTNQLTDKQLESCWVEGYGYGLGVRCPIEGSAVSDFGWGGAAGAYLAMDRENEFSFFYAQHMLSTPVEINRNGLTRVVYECIYDIDSEQEALPKGIENTEGAAFV